MSEYVPQSNIIAKLSKALTLENKWCAMDLHMVIMNDLTCWYGRDVSFVQFVRSKIWQNQERLGIV